jgi:hypothetical protein
MKLNKGGMKWMKLYGLLTRCLKLL